MSHSANDFTKSCASSTSSSLPMSYSKNKSVSTIELEPIEKITAEEQASTVIPSWRSLFVFTTINHYCSLIVSVLFAILSSLLKPAAAILFGRLFSAFTSYGAGKISITETINQTSLWCACLTALGAGGWLLYGGWFWRWLLFGERQARCARKELFNHLLAKNTAWYDLNDKGIQALLSRVQTQIRELQMSISQPFGLLAQESSAVIFSLALGFYSSWQLTFVIFATFPVAALALWLVSKDLSAAIEEQKCDLTLASRDANSAIASITAVKAYNGQNHEVWQYLNSANAATKSYLKQARANALQFGVVKFFTIGLFVQGFWYGLYLVRKGLDPGHVVTTFFACLSAIQAAEVILPQWLVLSKGMSAGASLKTITAESAEIWREKQISGLRPHHCQGEIEIKSVTFAYPTAPERKVLRETSFFFPAGDTSYIIGRSGSGKSTLGNLLLKFYNAESGQMLIDGNDVQDLDTQWIRQHITLIQQQSVLLNDTIVHNIILGTETSPSDSALWEAINTADLDYTLAKLPDGLKTRVSADGRSLSGGQQQRVNLARARLRDTPILVLDEATSALDKTGREKVTAMIRSWRHGKTTIIVTHDTAEILDHEYVYVMEDGVVIQEGYKGKLSDVDEGLFAQLSPASATTPTVDFPPSFDTSSEQLLYSRISDISAARRSTWVNYSKPRFSTIGGGTSQVSDLRSDAIWSSPMTAADFKARRATLPRGPPLSFASPELFPEDYSHESIAQVAYLNQQQPEATGHDVSSREARPDTQGGCRDKDSKDQFHQSPVYDAPNGSYDNQPLPFRTIFETVWPTLILKEKLVLVSSFVVATIVGACTPLFAYVFALLLGVFYSSDNQAGEARKYCLILLGIAFLDGFCSFAYRYALEYCGQPWITALRVEALKRILAQPKSWFDKTENTAERLTGILDRNAEEMRNILGRFVGAIIVAFWMTIISLIWAISISWKLSLVTLAAGPVVYGATRFFDSVSATWEARCNTAAEDASAVFAETISKIRLVRALTLEQHFTKKHDDAVRDAYKVGKRRAFYTGLLLGCTDSMSFFISSLVFYYGAILFSRKELSVGETIQVMQLLMFGIANVLGTLMFVPQINHARTAATHLLQLIRLPLSSHESTGRTRLESPLPVQVNGLSFAYSTDTEHQILSNVNFTLRPGTCTALVGPSGSGKSTIASLLLGFYPPTCDDSSSQSLTFNHVPISHCCTTTLRSQIAHVPQHPQLFPTTILSNILYGMAIDHPLATLEHAQRAAQDAGIHEFINSLPNSYNTIIGEGGMGLSGGQIQRLAIARAIVRRPALLILDEPTSALDAINAEGIRSMIKRFLRGDGSQESRQQERCVLTISHSVEMMRIADQVVVLEGGRVAEKGGFEDLRRRRSGRLVALIGEERVGSRRRRKKEIIGRRNVGLGVRFDVPEMEVGESSKVIGG